MNGLKDVLFIAHFNFTNDMNYEGLHELRKSFKTFILVRSQLLTLLR